MVQAVPAHAFSAAVTCQLPLGLPVYDIAIYIVQRTRHSVDTTAGDMHFNSHLNHIPRAAPVEFLMLYGGTVVYTTVDAMYLYRASAQGGRDKGGSGLLKLHGVDKFF